jgi:hypothetical protein
MMGFPQRVLLPMAATFLVGVGCTGAQAAQSETAEYLSDSLSGRIISVTQGWGELGVNVCAHLPNQKPLKLRIKDRDYALGLGHHASGEIVVDLNGEFKAFQADIGVQWISGKSRGSVVFQIFVDDKKVFDSGTVRENDPPRQVMISVEGADEMRLVVADVGDGMSDDCADWANARLVRDSTVTPAAAALPVDVAPFARTLTWDPKAVEGTRASRSEEMPAEDIAPYQELLPSPDLTYTVPAAAGTGCIGLQWDEDRLLRRVVITFPEATPAPRAEAIQLQYWSGESDWQGKWQPARTTLEKTGNSLAWTFGYQELAQGTQKVRWVFSGLAGPIVLQQISAFTRSRWKTVPVHIQPAYPGSPREARIEAYNGVFLRPNGEPSGHTSWDGLKPLLLKVRASAARPYKADRTVLRFRFPDAAFGVAVEDLLVSDAVYVPHAGLFVTRDPAPVTLADYLRKTAPQKTMLEEVRQRPDQDFRHAIGVLHNRTQDGHNWAPLMISLACDNRKFLVHREGSIVFNEYNRPDDYPGESDGVHTTAANINQWQLVPSFGSGQGLQLTRHLDGGWLPMPVTLARDKNITYRQMTFIAPVGEAPTGKPAWLREQALGVAQFLVQNTGTEPSDVRLSIRCAPLQDPSKPVRYRKLQDGLVAISGNRVLAFVDNRKALPLSWKIEATQVVLSGTLPAGAENACTVYLPAWQTATEDYPALLKDAPWAPRVEQYWKKLLEPAMQIDIPDELLSNLIRASQVHCLLAARNQTRSTFIVPWISSVHFGYPESEANAVMRGMDMLGHAEFARRGLEFYLKERNPAGFITILVHNKAAGVSCGYTLVGTGEVLWTLGEHYQRTRDQPWLRKVAPSVVPICQWIMRQRAKTKRLDARGGKAPEYGLMPPGVSADWNRFAYRFFNEAQYWRGLELAGRALADIGEPAAPAILEEAKLYREDIARAYHSMQAKMPVVPLKNGTWVPADPSLLGCYGNVEDFVLGAESSRSYVYSVEVGAHHLVATETLDPASKDAGWIIDHLEDVQFARTHWVKDKSKVDFFDWGGFAKMQPYYCRIAEIHAQRDDVKPFVRAYFNMIPVLVNFEELTFWEDMGTPGYATGAWNKTHETGWFLGQTRTMLVTERGDELWLAPFVTSHWLQDGMTVAVRNAPTRFGPVSYTIRSAVSKGRMEATIQLPAPTTARRFILRLRHPEGKPMRTVTLQGQPHKDFDPPRETITLKAPDPAMTVRAEY